MRGDALDILAVGMEEPGRVQVSARAFEQRYVLLDRVLDERMHEPERLAGEHDLNSREGVGRGRGRIDRERRQRGRPPKRHVVAEDRHGARQSRRGRPEAPDPDPQRASHRLGGESSGAARECSPTKAAIVREREQQLVHVERVAVRDVDARFHQRLIGALAKCAAAQFLHGLGAESRQALNPNPRVGRDSVERLRGLAALRRTARHHKRDRQLVEPMQDVQDELERGHITPVQVVDREHRGAGLRRARHRGEQAVGHREIAGVAGLENSRRPPRASAPVRAPPRGTHGARPAAARSTARGRAARRRRTRGSARALRLPPAALACRGCARRQAPLRGAVSCPSRRAPRAGALGRRRPAANRGQR